MRIEFTNGSVIEWQGRNKAKEHLVIRGRGSGKMYFFYDDEAIRKDDELMNKKEIVGIENGYQKDELMKMMDQHGNVQAEIPAHSELLNAIVGYQHDPQTHNYNRAERRRIIKAAKELEKKQRRKGRK